MRDRAINLFEKSMTFCDTVEHLGGRFYHSELFKKFCDYYYNYIYVRPLPPMPPIRLRNIVEFDPYLYEFKPEKFVKWQKLSHDIQIHALDYLDLKSIQTFSKVNKQSYLLSHNRKFSGKHYSANFFENKVVNPARLSVDLLYTSKMLCGLSEIKLTQEEQTLIMRKARRLLESWVEIFFSKPSILHADVLPLMVVGKGDLNYNELIKYIVTNCQLVPKQTARQAAITCLRVANLYRNVDIAVKALPDLLSDKKKYCEKGIDLLTKGCPDFISPELSAAFYTFASVLEIRLINHNLNDLTINGINSAIDAFYQRFENSFLDRQLTRLYRGPFSGLINALKNTIDQKTDQEIIELYKLFSQQLFFQGFSAKRKNHQG